MFIFVLDYSYLLFNISPHFYSHSCFSYTVGSVTLVSLFCSLFSALLSPEKYEDHKQKKNESKDKKTSDDCDGRVNKLTVQENSGMENTKKSIAPDKKEVQVPKLSDALHFPLQFWLVCLIVDLYTAAIYSFLGLAQ